VLDAVSAFALAARDAVARGAAVESTADFVAQLRAAGHVLVEAATGDEDALSRQLRDTTAAVRSLGAPVPHPAGPTPREMPEPEGTAEPAAAAALPPRGDDAADLAGSWARYEDLVKKHGLAAPSLDELLGTAGPASVHAPAVEIAPVEVTPREPAPAAEPEPVSIVELCYSGRSALARAASLRTQIVAQLAAGVTSDDLRDLIEEVLDLVDLGLQG
jgi:hypothetical protein